MKKYYDVIVRNRILHSKASFLADSFSVDENRNVKIKSKEFGDLVVHMIDEETLSVREIIINDEI